MVFLLLFLILLILLAVFREKKAKQAKKEATLLSLARSFGKLHTKKPNPARLAHTKAYHEKLSKEGSDAFFIDDTTAADLGLDALFFALDSTRSDPGENFLYHLLRSPQTKADDPKNAPQDTLSSAEILLTKRSLLSDCADFFYAAPKAYQDLGFLFISLGYPENYSFDAYFSHLQEKDFGSTKSILVRDLLLLVCLPLLFYFPAPAICAMVFLFCINLLAYTRQKEEMAPYLVCLTYLYNLYQIGEKIADFLQTRQDAKDAAWAKAVLSSLEEAKNALSALRFTKLLRTGFGEGTSSNPLTLLVTYLRMLFCLDGILFKKAAKEVRLCADSLAGLYDAVGFLDSALALANFRAALDEKEGWCVPTFTEDFDDAAKRTAGAFALDITHAYHPLLDQPVCNDLTTQRSILLTGSNASGKSTFLRTMALCSLLGQCLLTVPATCYRAPRFRLFTSLSLQDDLTAGKSYYLTEIIALKRMLDALDAPGAPLLCCIDEVLRGTNTAERIVAGTQICTYMARHGALCLVATHDLELTQTLADAYSCYCFDEAMAGADIGFSYKLRPGIAATTNALALLKVYGYPEEILSAAYVQLQKA